ncbi:MAG: MFS transporter [Myxococcota bacterium]
MSFLNDAASEMIAPLLPLFLTTVLGGAPAFVGIVEGAADAASAALKLWAGRWSDRLGRRKPLMLAGYALASATRPFLAIAGAPWHVLALRVVDRVGKGLRTSPRDALLAASVAEGDRAAAFGFHRAMDHAGALVGAAIAWVVLTRVTTDLRTIFAWSAVPAIVAVGLAAFVRDRPVEPARDGPVLPPLDPRVLPVLVAVGIAGLGLASEGFLLLRAADAGAETAMLPLLWMGLHAVKVMASLGAGPVADRLGRRGMIALGWLARAALYGGFAVATSPEVVAALFVAYGLHAGLTEGSERALVAEAGATGTAFGWYHLVTGAVALPAGLLVGGLWTEAGPGVAFGVAAGLTLAGIGPLAKR